MILVTHIILCEKNQLIIFLLADLYFTDRCRNSGQKSYHTYIEVSSCLAYLHKRMHATTMPTDFNLKKASEIENSPSYFGGIFP